MSNSQPSNNNLDGIDNQLEQIADAIDLIRTIPDGQTAARLETIVTNLADIARGHQQALRQSERDRQAFQEEIRRIWGYLLEQSKAVGKRRRRKDPDPVFPECTVELWEKTIRVDSIASWINQSVLYDAGAKTRVGSDGNEVLKGMPFTLFGSYVKYCNTCGIPPKSNTEFSPKVLELCRSLLRWNVERRRTASGSFIYGLRLKVDGQDDNVPTYVHWLKQQVDNV